MSEENKLEKIEADSPMRRTVPGGVAALTASREREKAYFQPGMSYAGPEGVRSSGVQERKRNARSRNIRGEAKSIFPSPKVSDCGKAPRACDIFADFNISARVDGH